jgi:hypothetical protein
MGRNDRVKGQRRFEEQRKKQQESTDKKRKKRQANLQAKRMKDGTSNQSTTKEVVQEKKPIDIVIEGLDTQHEHYGLMGVFEQVEGKDVNGKGVWKVLDGRNIFMYYSSNGSWFISDEQDMRTGQNRGLMMADSSAATPDQITETWQIDDAETWVIDAPSVQTRLCSSAEKKTAQAHMKQVQDQALMQGESKRSIVIGGLDDQHEYYDSMGSYMLVEDEFVNGRCVWQIQRDEQEGSDADDSEDDDGDDDEDDDDDDNTDIFLYYADTNQWYISLRENMQAGTPHGWMRLQSDAATPVHTAASADWEVLDIESSTWSSVKLSVQVAAMNGAEAKTATADAKSFKIRVRRRCHINEKTERGGRHR